MQLTDIIKIQDLEVRQHKFKEWKKALLEITAERFLTPEEYEANFHKERVGHFLRNDVAKRLSDSNNVKEDILSSGFGMGQYHRFRLSMVTFPTDKL